MAQRDDDFLRFDWGERLWSTGRLALSAGHLGIRRLIGLEGDEDARIGEDLARELDHMKGMAMKVGQILSYFDGVLPEATQKALRELQQGITAMDATRVRDVIEDEFGQPVESLFERFSFEPAASASVGQVHRARVDGLEVAVKLQYPGIRESIEADFRRLGRIGRLVTFMPVAADGKAIVEELRDRVLIECDYEAEARSQLAFRRAFATDPVLSIPDVIRARSGTTVITTAWVDGSTFYAFARSASPDERTAAARALIRFAFRSFFELGAVNADPHPGNYLFTGDGGITLLDFGCVRRFDPEFVDGERAVARTVVTGDRAGFEAAVVATGIVEDPSFFDFDVHWKMMRHLYAPYLEERFRFTLAWVREGMALNGPTNPNMMRLRVPPPWIWLQRLQWGLHAVLARLEAEGAFRDDFLALLERPLDPLDVS